METPLELSHRPYLFARLWPAEAPRAVVCLVHGLGEHSGRYAPLAAYLNAHGYTLLAMDLRGHGRSGGKRGHIPTYADALDDIDRLLERAADEFPETPRFLYGHSLGGNLVINYILRRPTDDLRGAIASGPWLRLAFQPPAYKVWLARLAGRLFPALLQPSGLNPHHLSHDPAVVQAYMDDPLVHDRISAALFLGVYEAGLWALQHADRLTLPLLLMHGSADQLTSPEASREFCEKAGEACTLRLWEGMYHEVHNEPEKAQVYRVVKAWLDDHLAPPSEKTP